MTLHDAVPTRAGCGPASDAGGGQIPVIDLSKAKGTPAELTRGRLYDYTWSLVELLLVSNRVQISSRVRVATLRLFGAEIGKDVIFRPRTRVRAPWNLKIGDRCWIGDGVWFHNWESIDVGDDVVISQESFLTTGSHALRRDMSLVNAPIAIESGAWITARCVVLGGARVGRSAVVGPTTVVRGSVAPNVVVGPAEPVVLGTRFPEGAAS